MRKEVTERMNANLTLQDRRELEELVKSIQNSPLASHIRMIKIFGSAVEGNLRPDSDIDVLCIADKRDVKLFRSLIAIAFDLFLRHGRYLSVKLLSEDQYSELTRLQTSFITNVNRKSEVLWKNH